MRPRPQLRSPRPFFSAARSSSTLAALLLGLAVTGCEETAGSAAAPLNHIGKGEWTVTGKVQDPDGVGVPNVLVQLLSTHATFGAKTDKAGGYSFLKMENATYNVKPSQAGYAFAPAFRDFTIQGANFEVAPFVATVLGGGGGGDGGGDADASSDVAGDGGGSRDWVGRTVKGLVRGRSWQTGKPEGAVAGVRVTLSAAGASIETWTSLSGEWRFADRVPPGSYTVAFAKPGWTVAPAQLELTVPAGDGAISAPEAVAHSSFKALPDAAPDSWAFPVASVVDTDGKKIAGVGFALIHPDLKEVETKTSDLDGVVTFGMILDGSYRLQPLEPGFTFAPPHFDFSFSAPTDPALSSYYQTGAVFVATPSPGQKHFAYHVSGRVLGADGKGKPEVVVSLVARGDNEVKNTITGADGTYVFPDVQHIGHDLLMVYVPSYDSGLVKPFAFAFPDKPELVMPDMQ